MMGTEVRKMRLRDYMLLEGKLEDFVKGMSKEDALKDENVAKLKKILKVSPEKAKARLEKWFAAHPEEGAAPSGGDSEEEPASVPEEVRSEADKLPEDKRGLWEKLNGIVASAAKKYAADKAGKLLDELLVGNFRDAVVAVYEKSGKVSDDKSADEALGRLRKFDGWAKAQKKADADSRKDSETSAEVDESSARFMAMWYSPKPDENPGKILSDLVKSVQQNAKKLEDDMKRMKAELKKMKIELTDEQLSTVAPVVMKMMNDKAGEKEIRKAVEQVTKQVDESVRSGISAMLLESRSVTQDDRDVLLLESACSNGMILEAVAWRLLREGWFGDKLAKLKNSKAAEFVKQKSAQLGKKLADAGSKALQATTKYSIGPILSLGGLAVGAFTGGLGAELIIKAMDFVERNGKQLRNSFERCATMYANTKGVVTKMDYHLVGDEKKTYSMRFYAKDMVWRVLNTRDQLKHPSLKYCKQVVDGEAGRKYRERLKKIWDPLFSDAKGGKIDFAQLLGQAKSVKISEKALAAFKEFAESYDRISADCIESPKIDTRAQK